MSFAWADRAGLLVASSGPGGAPPLAMVPVDARLGAWPAALLPVGGADVGIFTAGVRAMAFDSGTGTRPARQLAVVSVSPDALYIATLTYGDSPRLAAVGSLSLGSLTPTSAVFTHNGDLVVAARAENDLVQTALLLLRAR